MHAAELLLRVAGWAVNFALMLLISVLIYRPLKSEKSSINLPALIFLWVFTTTAMVMLYGLLGLLAFRWLAGGSLIAWLLVLLLPVGRAAAHKGWCEIVELAEAAHSAWSSLPRWLRWFTGIALAVSLIRFAVLIWALPPFVWDSLTYHLTNVAHWIQVEQVELFTTPMIRIYNPANYELLTAWFAVFLHHDVVIEAAGLPAYVLAFLAVYAGLRELHVGRTAAWLAALAYASMPGLLLAATGTKNDPHMASYYLYALALVIGRMRPGANQPKSNPLGQWILLALVLLLAAGTKAYIAHLLPGLALAGFVLWLQGRDKGILQAQFRNARLIWGQWSRWVQVIMIAMVLIGIFLGGFWNVRNWILKGNPFYPYGVSIEGNQVLSEGDRTARLSSHHLAENMKLLAQRFWDRQDPIRPDLPNTTGWGWFAYGLGLPTVLWATLRRKRFLGIGLGFALSWLLLMLSTRPSPWNMRYAIWFPAVFSYSFGFFFDVFEVKRSMARSILSTVLIGSLALNFCATVTYNRISAEQFSLMLARPVWARHASVLESNLPSQYENALSFVPVGESLGYNVSSNGFIYPLYKADFSQELVYIPFEVGEACGEIATTMKQAGTRYLFVAPEHSSDLKIAHLRYCGDNQTELRERARGLYVLREG